MTRTTDESLVRSWGFSHVFTWTDGPNAHYPPHTHPTPTTHLIRCGTLTITYPDDINTNTYRSDNNATAGLKDTAPTKETYSVGDRIDVAAGRRHEVWMGGEGCEYVIGEK